MREKRVYCVDCRAEVQAPIEEREESYTVKGDGPFTIKAQVPVCPRCGAELFDMELETENQRQLYNAYRKKHHLLLPEEIKAIREKYGLSQKSFSRLLGFGEVTIHRYESGSIQDAAHDTVIRSAGNPRFVKELYARNPRAVASRERRAFEERLKKLLEEEESIDARVRKAVAVLCFLASHIANLSEKKAYCLMWYADMLHYKEFGTSITGLRYEKQVSGPVPENSDSLLKAAETQGAIEIEEEPYPFQRYSMPQAMAAFLVQSTEPLEDLLEFLSETTRKRIYPMGSVDTSCLSPTELRVLRFVVQELGNRSFRHLQEAISREKAFQETKPREFIPYELAHSLTVSIPDS